MHESGVNVVSIWRSDGGSAVALTKMPKRKNESQLRSCMVRVKLNSEPPEPTWRILDG